MYALLDLHIRLVSSAHSLSVSPSHNHPFLAVGVQPGKQFRPVGNKQVYLYEWKTEKLHCIPFDIGKWCNENYEMFSGYITDWKLSFHPGHGGLSINVHTMFSPDGK